MADGAVATQVSVLQEENRFIKQKSKQEVADLEYKVEQLLTKKQRCVAVARSRRALLSSRRLEDPNLTHRFWNSLIAETGALHAAVAELETACRRHLEDKREMRAAALDQQLKLTDAQTRTDAAEKALQDERAKFDAHLDEWQHFQKGFFLFYLFASRLGGRSLERRRCVCGAQDLLTTVRVANDFKLETLAQMERAVDENRQLRERAVLLQTELDRLKNQVRLPNLI